MMVIGTGCNSKAEATETEETEPALPVEVADIDRGMIAAYVSGPVTLRTEKDADVVAKTGGVVENILVEEGHSVKAGQILAVLDDDRQVYELERTAATLKQAEAEFKRNEELAAKNLISGEIFERSKFALDGQKAAHKLAKLQRDYTRIKAPFNGVVAERVIRIGNMINANEKAFRVVDTQYLKAEMHIPEIELAKLTKGQEVRLAVDALNGTEYAGKVDMISPIVDPASGTVKITVIIANKDGALKPGMFGRARVLYKVHQDALLLPKEALLAEDSESTVFVIRDSMAFKQLVSLGLVNTFHYEVTKGLDQGDQVVITGQAALKDSSKVVVVSN